MAEQVSVVMPVYNGAHYLAAALRSVLQQSLPPAEIIVVDDGSTDASPAIVEAFRRDAAGLLRYHRQVNAGPAVARNRGVALASGDLVAFIDQDDLWLPEKLARQAELLARTPGAGYSITLVEYFLDAETPPPPWLNPSLLRAPQPGFTPSSLLVRRESFMRLGGFDPAFRSAPDLDWFARAHETLGDPARVPEVLVRYRVHRGNHSRFIEPIHRDMLRAVRRALDRQRGRAADQGGPS